MKLHLHWAAFHLHSLAADFEVRVEILFVFSSKRQKTGLLREVEQEESQCRKRGEKTGAEKSFVFVFWTWSVKRWVLKTWSEGGRGCLVFGQSKNKRHTSSGCTSLPFLVTQPHPLFLQCRESGQRVGREWSVVECERPTEPARGELRSVTAGSAKQASKQVIRGRREVWIEEDR